MADQWTWTAADGSVVQLSDMSAGYIVTAAGCRGLRSPNYTFTSSQYAAIDGAEVNVVRAEVGNPTLGLHISAGTPEEFRAKMRGLVRAMRPKAGPGQLSVRTDSGETRTLNCYYMSGLEGDEDHSVTSPGLWWKVVLGLYAPDPWWYGTERKVSVGLGSPNSFFPFFPLRLSPSTVQGEFVVDLSDADSPAYPLWTITGPGSTLTLTNASTGRVIVVNATIADGQTMVIDTRPGFQSVRRGDGTNLMGELASDPALWPLVEGLNVVTAALSGASSASRIEGFYAPRYAGI